MAEPPEVPKIERWETAVESFSPVSEKPAKGFPQPQTKPTMNGSGSNVPSGSILTGKQEHYLKRELISKQTQYEITELSSPTALQRFGAPFRSDAGEVPPEDSELPLLRYMFVHHVRNFPFLDQAREKEFWQDKLQIFLESFARKHISSSADRSEETKRRKLAMKAEKLVELMMVSGIPTASGYEERIRFEEMEIVDRGAQEQGVMVNLPEGRSINGWDVNVAGVKIIHQVRTVRQHPHAHFLIRVKERDQPERYVRRRFGDFARMHKKIRVELPGKVLPPLPRKNKKSTSSWFGGYDSDDGSISSMSTQATSPPPPGASRTSMEESSGGLRSYLGFTSSAASRSPSVQSPGGTPKTRSSTEIHTTAESQQRTLHREEQRVSLRAFLRTFLANDQIARSNAMREFLLNDPIELDANDRDDIDRRKELDSRRLEEAHKFYEIARERARELDVHMEKFRRSIVESNGLTKLFKEIKIKNTIAELSPEYQKFAEWLRIEVAATIYHLFLAEDNSPDLFAQAKRIHSLVPYTALKHTIRFANPAAVMKAVLDLFLAQPLGARSLMQRIFSMAINDGIRTIQKTIDTLTTRINEPLMCEKIRSYTDADEETKRLLREEAEEEQVDLLIVIMRTDTIYPEPESHDIERIFNAYVAWNQAVESTDESLRQGAELFAQLKQLLKLHTRQRDKAQMMAIIEEPVTLQLFRDLFTIFYEPLVRVYKSANVYSSVTDFASFVDDTIKVVEAAQRQDVAADPNQTVQSFIDLCERHQDDFYKFVHEVHIHDNGLFDQLMGWLEGILEFLRHGPKGGKLDMNALFQGAVDARQIDRAAAIAELDALVDWQMARKKWHHDKTRRKMAAEDSSPNPGSRSGGAFFTGGGAGITSSDFGIHELDIQDLGLGDAEGDSDEEEDEDEDADLAADPIEAERKRRKRMQEALKSRAGEPVKPDVSVVHGLMPGFLAMLRMVLAE